MNLERFLSVEWSEMPSIILSDEERRQIDFLLIEHDPELHRSTAALLENLSDEDRQVLCTWVRESQRQSLEIAIPMRSLVDRAEAGGLKATTNQGGATLEDGWITLLTTFDQIHALQPRANEIMEKLGDEAWEPFCDLCVQPANQFASVHELYESPSLPPG